MKRILFGFGVLCLALSTTSPAELVAQDRGTDQPVAANLGYGIEPGNAVIFIVAEDFFTEFDGRGWTLPGRVEVTGSAGSPVSVGNCHRDELPFQAGELIDPDGEDSPIPIEFAVLYPDDVELPMGVTLGSGRPGGPCGPGYRIIRRHVLATDY